MSDPDLFGVGTPARKPKAKATVPTGAMQRALDVYIAEYKRRVNDELPHITKPSASFLKQLIVKYGEEKVIARLRAFMDLPAAREKGYELWLFNRMWNELATRASASQSVPTAEKTDEYLRRLKQR